MGWMRDTTERANHHSAAIQALAEQVAELQEHNAALREALAGLTERLLENEYETKSRFHTLARSNILWEPGLDDWVVQRVSDDYPTMLPTEMEDELVRHGMSPDNIAPLLDLYGFSSWEEYWESLPERSPDEDGGGADRQPSWDEVARRRASED